MTDDRTFTQEIPLDATPDQVWDAIATRPGLTAWFAPMDVAPDEHGRSADGDVVRWEPGKAMTVRTPVAEDGSTSSFEYLIEARDGGTSVLRFTQTGFHSDDWESEYEATARGWGLYFHTLGQYLSNFSGRPATYIAAEGPESVAGRRAWLDLLSAIGLPGPVSPEEAGAVAPGQQVHFYVPGLGPVDGEVDYHGPSHLGIRVDDALLRFHDRSLLGMSVALGHHYYGADQDEAKLQQEWQSWLTAVYTD
jgi:uncharacterized protein YndB with AHSA1/START domain